MELLTPSLSLIAWTFLSFTVLGIIVYAVYHLANNKSISPSDKLLWLLLILVVPVLGALVYLATKKTRNQKATV